MAKNQTILYLNSEGKANQRGDGDPHFTYRMTPPLYIPLDATPVLKVLEANIVYTQPNIKTTEKLKVTVSLTSESSKALEIEFPPGLYSFSDINAKIVAACESDTDIEDTMLRLEAVSATQKVHFVYHASEQQDYIEISFAEAPTLAHLLGFTQETYTYDYAALIGSDSTLVEREQIAAETSANFDVFSHYLLNLSCVTQGYASDGKVGQNAACAITPAEKSVLPGGTITFRPINPIPNYCPALCGHTASIDVTVTTNSGETAVLQEAYSAVILIEW